MRYCPKCHSEYKDGITHCVDCHVPLIIDDKNKNTNDQDVVSMEPVVLAPAMDQLDGDILLTLLEEAKIPAFKKDKGVGGYMRVYMGYSVYGADIYVEKSAYNKAKEILDSFMAEADDSFHDFAKVKKEEEVSAPWNPFVISSSMATRVILGISVAGLILAAIL